MSSQERIDEVLDYWFEELSPEDWFKPDAKRDAEIRSRFGALYEELLAGVPQAWLVEPDGYLAAILVLDQFPRNMFRGDSRAFCRRCRSPRPRQASNCRGH